MTSPVQGGAGLSPAKQQLLERWRLGKAKEAGIPRRSGEGPVPLSYAQQRFWLLHMMSPDGAAFHLPRAYRLRGPLDAAALGRSLSEIVRRHEVLRTTVRLTEGFPVQVVNPFQPLHLPLVLLDALAEPAREEEALRLAAAEARRGFDLAVPPLFRALLLRLGEDDHALILNVHHIVSDGWSLGLFLRELEALYTAFAAGAASPLPELPLQYADFSVWQRQRLEEGAFDSQISFWLKQLEGSPRSLRLPPGLPAPEARTSRGAVRGIRLPAEPMRRLAAVAQEELCTRFMALFALYVVLLHRYSGEEDLLVGTPVASRGRVELEGLLGCFINTLMLRALPAAGLPLRSLLRQVRETTLEAFARQDVPFELLLDRLRAASPGGEAPAIHHLFVYQRAGEEPTRFAGAGLQQIPTGLTLALSDLTLTVAEDGEGVRAFLTYDEDLFEEAAIGRMIHHLETLLAGMAAAPDERLSDLPLLSQAERAQLARWNDTAAPLPRAGTLHELLLERAAVDPDAIALADRERRLSYGELDRWSNRLARYLSGLGVGTEVRVGISLERSPELVAGVLGILKAGGAYVSLDPNYPRERLAWLLADSAVPLLLTGSSLADRLPGYAGRIVRLDEEREAILATSDEPLPPRALPENLAYVVYTSGSTGQPKGVLVPHRGIVNMCDAHVRLYGLRPGDRSVHFHSPSFDAWLFELALGLAAGACLRQEPVEGLLPSEGLLELLQAQRMTYLVMASSALAALPVGELPDLRLVVTGGEPIPGGLVGRWSAPGRRFFNSYGPAETSICATWFECTEEAGRHLIGRPTPNLQVHLLDRALQPLPVGLPGEICIGGMGLARGYLGRQDLTAARFVPDPFGAATGGRLYRTGDLARYLPDGTIEFLGRTDDQVKIRGFRVEPGEIQAVLERHEGVAKAFVVVREDSPGDRRLVAYAVPRVGSGSTLATALRDHARAHLPEPMVPAAFVLLASLPLTPNDKVDVKALPAPDWRAGEEARYVAPRSDLECLLAEVWQEVLGVDQVGIHANFFDIGGNSLLLVKVYGRLRPRLAGAVSLVDLVKNPTLAALADHLERGRPAAAAAPPQAERDAGDRLRGGRERLRQSLARRRRS